MAFILLIIDDTHSTSHTTVRTQPMLTSSQLLSSLLKVVLLLFTLSTLALSQSLAAEPDIKVAVAANFSGAFKPLQAAFEKVSNHSLSPSFASTGQLYAQILHGAPFDVFLSADVERVDKLIHQGLAQRDSGFVYARGRLALWSRTSHLPLQDGEIFKGAHKDFQQASLRLSIANPKTAPYGRAAQETLASLGADKELSARMITGQSITQVMQFVASGNVTLGFVAQSQLIAIGGVDPSDYWLVPEELHHPINQKAVLLTTGRDNPGALAFLQFLRSAEAISIIEGYGYSTLPTQ